MKQTRSPLADEAGLTKHTDDLDLGVPNTDIEAEIAAAVMSEREAAATTTQRLPTAAPAPGDFVPTPSKNSLNTSLAAKTASAAQDQATTGVTSRPGTKPAAPEPAPQDDGEWQETTEFGYRLAATWDEHDPNQAINAATNMARSGKSVDEIVTYLVSCNVSPDEAQYVAAMTGARRIAPEHKSHAAALGRKRRRRAMALALAIIVTGLVAAYFGYADWQSGS